MYLMLALALLQVNRPGQPGFGGPAPGGGGGEVMLQLVYLVVGQLIQGALWWGAFVKAGQPGWAGFIPIYREIVLCQIADKPVWWVVTLLCPIVFIVLYILILIEIANRFGQGAGFAIGMFCCGIIFIPILSYGSSEYMGGRRGRRRRRPRDEDEDEDEDEDDRPRRRRPRDEEEEEEERPRRPSKPARARDEDDDEDEPPRRRPRPRDDDDDDEPDPRVRRRPRDDD